jgi:hypothetical protein
VTATTEQDLQRGTLRCRVQWLEVVGIPPSPRAAGSLVPHTSAFSQSPTPLAIEQTVKDLSSVVRLFDGLSMFWKLLAASETPDTFVSAIRDAVIDAPDNLEQRIIELMVRDKIRDRFGYSNLPRVISLSYHSPLEVILVTYGSISTILPEIVQKFMSIRQRWNRTNLSIAIDQVHVDQAVLQGQITHMISEYMLRVYLEGGLDDRLQKAVNTLIADAAKSLSKVERIELID